MFTCLPTMLGNAGAAGTTWNPADKSSSVTLSNGNLTATGSGTSDSGVRGAAGKTSGKFYVEYTVGSQNIVGGDTGVGISNTSAALNSMGAAAVGAALIFITGNVWVGGSNKLNVNNSYLLAGVVVRLAVDLDNEEVWFALGTGNWNGNSANDPTQPSTGLDISTAISGAVVPCATFNAANDAFTANFGASPFTYSVPSGFTAGWPA